ncbi:hypothetical protein V1477_014509 [Vespula maculifrons]|uniref:Uncharacterized protein n=1 Tax=Vespula maculifrons TaxID=7453 RepID=A0ABD2BHM2_VESMC
MACTGLYLINTIPWSLSSLRLAFKDIVPIKSAEENPNISRNSLGVVSLLQKPLVRSSASKVNLDIRGKLMAFLLDSCLLLLSSSILKDAAVSSFFISPAALSLLVLDILHNAKLYIVHTVPAKQVIHQNGTLDNMDQLLSALSFILHIKTADPCRTLFTSLRGVEQTLGVCGFVHSYPSILYSCLRFTGELYAVIGREEILVAPLLQCIGSNSPSSGTILIFLQDRSEKISILIPRYLLFFLKPNHISSIEYTGLKDIEY